MLTRQWELKAPTGRSRSDCVHEQVAKANSARQQSCRDGLRMSALLVGEGEEMNIAKMIQENIRATASRRNDEGIITAEGMIPRMDDKEYHRKRLDISYADRTPAEKLDHFLPRRRRPEPFPVFVEVHGGAWYFGQKRSVEFEPFLYGLNRGYACVSLGYTLSPEGHYPLPVLEIKSAIRFLRGARRRI